ncbi:hypothetical protein BpHYR1_008345 [Brachionus plicatilis]|uniref:Uncharacterized protein n=1 Tax=Brachionus plicatilis TaxID=10195 RepID=A0A3M7SCQ4_BRAPC|nr:hypothetical protein BpHYR1_008345 [Brachionus plicatilis]
MRRFLGILKFRIKKIRSKNLYCSVAVVMKLLCSIFQPQIRIKFCKKYFHIFNAEEFLAKTACTQNLQFVDKLRIRIIKAVIQIFTFTFEKSY